LKRGFGSAGVVLRHSEGDPIVRIARAEFDRSLCRAHRLLGVLLESIAADSARHELASIGSSAIAMLDIGGRLRQILAAKVGS